MRRSRLDSDGHLPSISANLAHAHIPSASLRCDVQLACPAVWTQPVHMCCNRQESNHPASQHIASASAHCDARLEYSTVLARRETASPHFTGLLRDYACMSRKEDG